MEKSDVHSLNQLAKSLVDKDHSGKEMIQKMQADVNSRFVLQADVNYLCDSSPEFFFFYYQLGRAGKTSK